MAKLLLGKEVTEELNRKLQTRVDMLRARGTVPSLGIVRCGEEPADLSYEQGAMKRADAIGVNVRTIVLPVDVSMKALIEQIHKLNADDSIHGVLMFRPLPKPLRAFQNEICNALVPEKDVDCMTDISCAGVYEGRTDLGFPPCTAQACMEILEYYGIDPCGKKVAVIGRSLVIGRPVAMMLMHKNATITICHTRTVDVPAVTREADIIISAVGKLNILNRAHVAAGQIIIDVSMNWDDKKPNSRGGVGAFSGDAAFDEVEPIVEAITPVPGGVGSVTSSVLMAHVVEAAERAADRDLQLANRQ